MVRFGPMQAYQAPGYAPNPMGALAIVATGLMAGAGIVGFVAGALTLRDARVGDIPAPVPTPRRRPGGGGGGGGGTAPEAEPTITCGRPSDSHQSCGQYVIQYKGHTAFVDFSLNFAGSDLKVQILGRNALLAHEHFLTAAEIQPFVHFNFAGRLCSTLVGESEDTAELIPSPNGCQINAGVRYALNWIDDNA